MPRPGPGDERNPWAGKLKQLRINRGFASASAAAHYLDMNVHNYLAIEAGRNITMSTLDKVLRGLNADLIELAVIREPATGEPVGRRGPAAKARTTRKPAGSP